MVYWIVWIFVCVFSIFLDHKELISKVLFFYFFIFLLFFIGLRYQVGGDWDSYLLIYQLHNNLPFKDAIFISDPAYSLLNFVSIKLGFQEIFFVNFICSTLVCLFLYLSFLKLRKYWYCLLIYFPYHILAVSLGYTRQSVAIAISIYSFILLLENKKIAFVFCVLLAALFHSSAIFFIIFLFLNILNENKYLRLIYSYFSFIIIFFVLYLSNKNQLNSYVSSESEISSSGVLMRLSAHIIPVFIYFIYRKFLIEKQLSVYLDYVLYLIFICFILSFSFSTLADRLNLYLVVFDLIVVCSLVDVIKTSNRRLLIYSIVAYYSIFIFIWIYYGNYTIEAWLPYRNYLIEFLF